MKTLSVAKWSEFQHYKHRNPPWIKLHNQLLSDYDFSCLQDASKLHLVLIWMLASKMNNIIPHDPAWLKKHLSLEVEPNLNELITKGFLVKASKVLAGCLQSADPEKRRVEKSRVETDARAKLKTKKKWITPDWINKTAWAEFEQHRTDMRKPLSNLARTKAANQLKNLTHEQQQACVDNSIQSRWPGLYPDKINGSNKRDNQARPKTRNEIHRDIYRDYAAEGVAEDLDSGDIRENAAEIREPMDISIRRLPREH